MGRRRPEENPKIGKHPDLLSQLYRPGWPPPQGVVWEGGPASGDVARDTDVVVDWMELSPSELKKLVSSGQLVGEELDEVLAEIIDWFNQAQVDGDEDALVRAGMSPALARAVSGLYKEDLHDELVALSDEIQEAAIEAFVDWWKSVAEGDIDNEVGHDADPNAVPPVAASEPSESYVDGFQSWLAHQAHDNKLLKIYRGEEPAIEGDPPDDEIVEIMKDPGLWILAVDRNADSYSRTVSTDAPWSVRVGVLHGEIGGIADSDLPALVVRMTDKALEEALKKLANHEPYLTIDHASRNGPDRSVSVDAVMRWSKKGGLVAGKDLTRAQFNGDYSLSYHVSECEDWRVYASIDDDALEEAVSEKRDTAPGDYGEPPVVYRYAGTNATVAGASARGLYVVELRAKPVKQLRDGPSPVDLVQESTELGHCIGNPKYGHPQSLMEGAVRVFSIRTEAGKRKFTIEVNASSGVVKEIKGKANRLPGFEPDKEDKVTKPDEVRAVVEFLQSLGYPDSAIAEIRDLRGAIKAMQEAGVDPFTPPPPRKARPHRDPRQQENPAVVIPVRGRALREVQAAYNRPMGGVWGW